MKITEYCKCISPIKQQVSLQKLSESTLSEFWKLNKGLQQTCRWSQLKSFWHFNFPWPNPILSSIEAGHVPGIGLLYWEWQNRFDYLRTGVFTLTCLVAHWKTGSKSFAFTLLINSRGATGQEAVFDKHI